MHPDDEPDLKAAFAELYRRQREHAPAFDPMRERALRTANESPAPRRLARMTVRLAWASAVCVIALVIWWTAQTSRRGPLPVRDTAAKEDMEQLIAAIEQHLEVNDLEYPTDLLLVENQSDFSH